MVLIPAYSFLQWIVFFKCIWTLWISSLLIIIIFLILAFLRKKVSYCFYWKGTSDFTFLLFEDFAKWTPWIIENFPLAETFFKDCINTWKIKRCWCKIKRCWLVSSLFWRPVCILEHLDWAMADHRSSWMVVFQTARWEEYKWINFFLSSESGTEDGIVPLSLDPFTF